MPIVTLTLRGPKSAEFKSNVLGAIHDALVDIGVSPNDLFHRVIELSEENFQYDATFPDVRGHRNENYLLVEILLGIGRSVKIKKQLLSGITSRLSALGHDPENLMVVFQDVPWENWSPAGGRFPNV
ncbi:MAG: tautomerase family protein [Proteobacteria bacterium]|nr:tautomerase family protein [Pseudomonadota bacterium]MBU4472405.1 tautomerase family protein [Pseudomonadota bacterium]MCG2751002.1 tautomerase family protein [Desulfobacteraceae bacterium]